MEQLLILTIIAVPIVFILLTSKSISVDDFLYNGVNNSSYKVLFSVICGNVGVGTFVVYYSLTQASPVIGLAAVFAGIAGLIICAILAGHLHDMAKKTDTIGLVDLLVVTHEVRRPLLIWLPVAVVFLLRVLVQLGALALVLSQALGISYLAAVALGTLASGAYIIVGGYRAATETDVFHGLLIVLLMMLAALGMPSPDLQPETVLDLGPYSPVLLIGICLFLPFSTILGVDNWQRIATARSAAVARRSYLLGALFCGAIYLTVVMAALSPDAPADVLEMFRSLMPASMPWLADILLISAIISSIDTFTVPLVSTFARRGFSLMGLRMFVFAILVVAALAAALLGDILAGVIAAFNSLAVFLPAVFGAFVLRSPRPQAAIASMGLGVLAILALSLIDSNSAAPIGFALSVAIYWWMHAKHTRLLNMEYDRTNPRP